MKRKTKLQVSFWISFFVGITFAYGIWLLWKKLTEFIGDGWIILVIIGIVLLIAAFAGYFSWKKISRKFTT